MTMNTLLTLMDLTRVLIALGVLLGTFGGITSEPLKNTKETRQSNDKHADRYREVHAVITGLPDLVTPYQEYELRCSVSGISHKARMTWQIAPLGDMWPGNVNCDENSDGTFFCMTIIYLSFTLSDHGNDMRCLIELDNGDSIDAPYVRIKLVEEADQYTVLPELVSKQPAVTDVTKAPDHWIPTPAEHVPTEPTITDVSEAPCPLVTTTEHQTQVPVPTQSVQTDSPVIIPSRDNDGEKRKIPAWIPIIVVGVVFIVIIVIIVIVVWCFGCSSCCHNQRNRVAGYLGYLQGRQ